MKIILEQPSYKKVVTIETEADDLTITDIRDELLIPALLALGFHPQNVQDLFFDEGEFSLEDKCERDEP